MTGARHGSLPGLVVLLVLGSLALAASASDPYRSQQWYLDRINAPQSWDTTRGEGAVVAIVDSGVQYDHPDLVGRFLRDQDGEVVGWDFVDNDADASDENGHGTMVAGIVAAAAGNGEGIAGVAPRARLMPIRVLDAEGGGSSRDVDRGIRWAVDHGADVVNLSLEAVTGFDDGPRVDAGAAPVTAVDYAWENGVVVVAAAGNSGHPFTDYPPSSPVVLVGAVDRRDQRAGFSDAGRLDAVVAPGVEIVSTWCMPTERGGCDDDVRYGEADGTSFAAPQVAAAVALLRSADVDADTSVSAIRETAEDLGAQGPDMTYGHGRLDTVAALRWAGREPAPTPPTGDPAPDEDTTPADGRGPTPAESPTSAPTTAPTSPATPAGPSGPGGSGGAPSLPPVSHTSPTGAPDVTVEPPTAIEGLEPSRPATDDAIRIVAAFLVAVAGAAVLEARKRIREDG